MLMSELPVVSRARAYYILFMLSILLTPVLHSETGDVRDNITTLQSHSGATRCFTFHFAMCCGDPGTQWKHGHKQAGAWCTPLGWYLRGTVPLTCG